MTLRHRTPPPVPPAGPEPHPLAVLLPDWRWFSSGDRPEMLLLHPSGLHFYLYDKMLGADDLDKVWPLVTTACAEALAMGVTGRCDVEVTSQTYERVVVDPIQEARRPGAGSMMVCTAPASARLVPVKR